MEVYVSAKVSLMCQEEKKKPDAGSSLPGLGLGE